MGNLPFRESYKGVHVYAVANPIVPIARPIMVTFYPPASTDDGPAVFSHTIWMSTADAIGLASMLNRAVASLGPDAAGHHAY